MNYNNLKCKCGSMDYHAERQGTDTCRYYKNGKLQSASADSARPLETRILCDKCGEYMAQYYYNGEKKVLGLEEGCIRIKQKTGKRETLEEFEARLRKGISL